MKSTKNAFIDTNILVYAANERIPLDQKTIIARELLLQPNLVFSVQVLNEFIASARSAGKLNFTIEQEGDWVSRWMEFPIASLTADSFSDAIKVHQDYQLSHWDSLIIASAHLAGCDTIYSEDMNHGQSYGGITVINPFL